MKLSKYENVVNVCYEYAKEVSKGTRQKEELYNKLIIDYVKKNGKRTKKSNIIVYTEKENLGTNKWTHIIETIHTCTIDGEIRETEKSYIVQHKYTKTTIKKSKVIGWLHDDY